MDNLFDVLKMVNVNHRGFASKQVVITDLAGKPNGLLTDLFRDTVSNIHLFLDMAQLESADDVLTALADHTPLPDDVLDEYAKILKEPLLKINFAPQKGQIELVVRG
ncbi:hypothetical protein [Secundilactobacillus kimchicus]|uniref:Uncharacterized protein n=1 Tax=Secundilactobacillus kimchicus JCM 15530 TaxID=1302272 RepID=A0A0R1HYG9_9LACO|nr:hypothetical protein [Secundilactobacillus kimchicus]KRK48657.1 hypothetical protein FC96_GL000971 [Secundilactobacillus kimchicus JCM 15530]